MFKKIFQSERYTNQRMGLDSINYGGGELAPYFLKRESLQFNRDDNASSNRQGSPYGLKQKEKKLG